MSDSQQPKSFITSEHREIVLSPIPGAEKLDNAGNAATLSPEHREYILQRHGTLDLDPVPSMDPADPLNWPAWKVTINGPIGCLSNDAHPVTEEFQLVDCGIFGIYDHFHSSRNYSGV